METQDWRHQAACRGENPELWFSLNPADRQVAHARTAQFYSQFVSHTRTSVPVLVQALRATQDRLLALCYASDDGTEYEHVPGCEGEDTCPACWAASIRQALEGFPATDPDEEL